MSALAGLLAALGAVVVLAGAAGVARHRASAAADLAALAAAGSAVLGDPGACRAGERVAAANGARLISCRVGDDAVAEVTVVVPVHLGPLGLRTAVGRARAGPVEQVSPLRGRVPRDLQFAACGPVGAPAHPEDAIALPADSPVPDAPPRLLRRRGPARPPRPPEAG